MICENDAGMKQIQKYKKRAKGFLYLSPMLVQTYEYTKKSFYTSSILRQDSFAQCSQINRDNIEPK